MLFKTAIIRFRKIVTVILLSSSILFANTASAEINSKSTSKIATAIKLACDFLLSGRVLVSPIGLLAAIEKESIPLLENLGIERRTDPALRNSWVSSFNATSGRVYAAPKTRPDGNHAMYDFALTVPKFAESVGYYASEDQLWFYGVNGLNENLDLIESKGFSKNFRFKLTTSHQPKPKEVVEAMSNYDILFVRSGVQFETERLGVSMVGTLFLPSEVVEHMAERASFLVKMRRSLERRIFSGRQEAAMTQVLLNLESEFVASWYEARIRAGSHIMNAFGEPNVHYALFNQSAVVLLSKNWRALFAQAHTVATLRTAEYGSDNLSDFRKRIYESGYSTGIAPGALRHFVNHLTSELEDTLPSDQNYYDATLNELGFLVPEIGPR